jgi:glycosyltransferase involved in cell wall biosynthesis
MFSVVIPLFNKQDFISRTVSSVLAQTYPDFELIVVDDGSTDGSLAKLAHISDPRLRVVRQANAGEGPARNTGIRESSRTWIALLDADDYWFQDHLAELAKMASRYPEAGMVATAYIEGEEPNARQPAPQRSEIRLIDYFSEAAKQVGIVWSSAVGLRKDVATQVGGFEAFRTGADLEYWARMALAAPVVRSSRITAYYFRNDQSVMAQMEDRTLDLTPAQTVFEIWPSVAYLQRIKEAPQYLPIKSTIERYQRNAGYLSMIGLLVRGEVEKARHVAKSLPGQGLDRATLVVLFLHLPTRLLRLIVQFRAMLRRNLSRFQMPRQGGNPAAQSRVRSKEGRG